MTLSSRRPRVVVCGTKFGRIYLAAFRDASFPFELAGILARGSDRSRACARFYGVPLLTDASDVPSDVEIACVVVGAGVNGGRGAEIARTLMARGVHVLQEHPLHERELAECLRDARRHGVRYHLNTHYVHIEPVRRFIATARELVRRQPPVFIDAACGIQTLFTLCDILGEALGRLRPWGFAEPAARSADLAALSDARPAFSTLTGTVAGVPICLSVQNSLDPADPDNHVHVMHRITIGTQGGTLTLVGTHGPVIWCPRAHMPADVRDTVSLDTSAAGHFDLPSATSLGPAEAPTYREILRSIWPAGVRRALLQLQRAIDERHDPQRRDQHHLAVAQLWHETAARIGPLTMTSENAPQILGAAEFSRAFRDDLLD